jgi:hypothetical protein
VLLCLDTLLGFIYCIFVNLESQYKLNYPSSKKLVKPKKPIDTNGSKFTLFLDKINNKYNLIIPSKNLNNSVSNKPYQKLVNQLIKSLVVKMNLFTKQNYTLISINNINVYKFNSNFLIDSYFTVKFKNIIRMLKIVIIYINTKEFYITSLKNIEYQIESSKKYRNSKFYNKWII